MRPYIKSPLSLLVVLLALTPLAYGQAGQNPKPPEADDVVRVSSILVQTDVMVFDREGHFVNSLKREDFELRIDGKARAIDFFDHVTAGAGNEEAQLSAARGIPVGKTTTSVPVPSDRGRLVVFYLDDLHLGAANLLPARQLILHFIEQDMGQNDQVVLISATGQIGFLQQFTNNKAVLRAAVERIKPQSTPAHDLQRPHMTLFQALQIDHGDRSVTDFFVAEVLKENPRLGRTLAEIDVKARAGNKAKQEAVVTTNTLGSFAGTVRATSKLSGRKIVFFISDGFFLDDRNSDARDRVQRITSSAARNGVVIYSLDARGLVTTLRDPSSPEVFDPQGRIENASRGELAASQDAMNALSRDSGGSPIFNTNALGLGVTKALKDTAAYYLLAWKPEDEGQAPGKFRHLSVSLLGHPELTVRVRQGFFDNEPPLPAKETRTKAEKTITPVQPKTPEVLLREAIATTNPNTQLPVALNLAYLNGEGKNTTLVASMQLNSGTLAFTNEGGKEQGSVNIGGTVFNDSGQAGAAFNERIPVEPDTQPTPTTKEIVYNYRVQLPPGLYQVRVGARDAVSGKVGTAFEWIEIPDLSRHQLALSSLITGERPPLNSAATSDPNASAEAVPRVDHHFHRNAVLRFFLYTYNAGLSPADAKPDVAIQVQILRDGQPVITTPSKRISTEGGQQLDRLFYGADVSLDTLPPGRYLFQISVVDRVARSTASQQMHFEIE